MSNKLLSALALMLVLEGIMTFVWPAKWREIFAQILALGDGQIRFIGLSSMLIGLVLILVFN